MNGRGEIPQANTNTETIMEQTGSQLGTVPPMFDTSMAPPNVPIDTNAMKNTPDRINCNIKEKS